MNWDAYPNFTEAELTCKHTGRCDMDEAFMARLQHTRELYGKPMAITSGFRDPTHPAEASKDEPGEHTTGHAADIGVQGPDALALIAAALAAGFPRIGVQQKGSGRFIHLGDSPDFPPGIWSY